MNKVTSDPYFKFLHELAKHAGKPITTQQIADIANNEGISLSRSIYQELFHTEVGGTFLFKFESYYKYTEMLELQSLSNRAKKCCFSMVIGNTVGLLILRRERIFGIDYVG